METTKKMQESQRKPKQVIKCEYDKCPCTAEYKLITTGSTRYLYCEKHKNELKLLKIVVTEEEI